LAKAGIIMKTSRGKLLRTFAADAEQYIRFLSMDDGIVVSAAESVHKYSLRPGDALQLASLERARELASGYNTEVVLVASDNALCEAASKEGFTVANPETATKRKWKGFLR
jgi:predicted nucleic acid-binding protein